MNYIIKRARDKRFYNLHRDEIIQRKIAFQRENKEKKAKYGRDYYQAHKEERRIYKN